MFMGVFPSACVKGLGLSPGGCLVRGGLHGGGDGGGGACLHAHEGSLNETTSRYLTEERDRGQTSSTERDHGVQNLTEGERTEGRPSAAKQSRASSERQEATASHVDTNLTKG